VIALRHDDIGYELFARTASGVTTGPHLAAAEIDWGAGDWRNWPAVMTGYQGRSVHVALSPPGLPLWYGLLNAIFDAVPDAANRLQLSLMPYQCSNYALLAYTPAEWASAWFGMLMPLWAALAVFPLYGVARRVIGAEAARWPLLWFPLIPALALFVPTWNTLYPLFSLSAFWLLLIGLEKRRGVLCFIAAGLLTGLLTFANFSLVPLAGLLGFYTLLHYGRQWQKAVIVGLWFGVGFIALWLIYGLVTGLTPLDLLRVAFDEHLSLERPYIPWLWLHFWEWALLTGIPLIVLWLWTAWRQNGPPRLLAVALLLTMIALLLSGTARGETGRVWLFFSPFVLIVAGSAIRATHAPPLRNGILITAAQAALLIALASTWNVIGADLTPPDNPPGAVNASRPANAHFDGAFQLIGWDAESDTTEGAITLRLNWQADSAMTTPYWFSALLVGPDGAALPEAVVWQPLQTRYPTTCWRPGETVGDTISLPLPANAQAGEWWISLAAFGDATAQQRLPVTLADGAIDQQVGLGPVSVG